MDISRIANMTHSELMDCISSKKEEIAKKIKDGDTEPSFSIGASSFTVKEWNRLLAKVDKNNEQVRKEQEKRKEMLDKERLEKKSLKKGMQGSFYTDVLGSENTKRNYFMEKINGTYKSSFPYGNLSEDGVISYNGVEFICNAEKNALCLGDMSDESNVLTILLEGGGSLMVNRNNLGQLADVISMFTSEDIKRIMCAKEDDDKAQEAQM